MKLAWLSISFLFAANMPALALNCEALIVVPSDNSTSLGGEVSADLTGRLGKLLGAKGDAEVLSETRTLLNPYPESERSLQCSKLSYLACGILEKDNQGPLAVRVDQMIKILDACQIVTTEKLIDEAEIGPVSKDERVSAWPVTCKRSEGDVICNLFIQSNDRDRELHLGPGSVEIVDEAGNSYFANTFGTGSKLSRRLRYEFKADTKTAVQVKFENINRSSKIIQNLLIAAYNPTDKDSIDIRYRNVKIL